MPFGIAHCQLVHLAAFLVHLGAQETNSCSVDWAYGVGEGMIVRMPSIEGTEAQWGHSVQGMEFQA